MPRCPHCNYDSQVISAFCPACGGAMQTPVPAPMPAHIPPQVQMPTPEEMPTQSNMATPPYGTPAYRPVPLGMGWLRFLVMFLLPLNIINGILTLIDLPQLLAQIPSSQTPALLSYGSIVLSVVQLALLGYALWGLFTQKWAGVQVLLLNYLINAAFSVVMIIVLLVTSGPSLIDPLNPVLVDIFAFLISVGVSIGMFFINLVYFRKRRGFFLPEKQ